MRSLALLVVTLWLGCASSTLEDPAEEPPLPPPPTCDGLRCRVTDCARQGLAETTLSGTVFAPNGTLPLHGVTVYVPDRDPGPLPDGAQCTRCIGALPGDPIVLATSDEMGRFTLVRVPDGDDIPVVITIGKWRRQIRIPVTACTENRLTAAQGALPRHKGEGDLPKLAIVTGNCDALECLVRKLGVDDAEFTPSTGDGRVHLFTSNGAARTAAGQPFTRASALWSSADHLKPYDLAMFSCECSQLPGDKPQAAMDALKAYADLGGRVFLSHYHNVWISGEYGRPWHAPQVWPTIATCDIDLSPLGTGMIDDAGSARGPAFASWMMNVGASPAYGRIPIMETRQTCRRFDQARAERWVYLQDGANQVLQNFQFSTPNEAAEEERCGKVVFSDMHVASGSISNVGVPFPNGCSTAPMTPQEKALAYMFFDIATCVGPIL